MSQLCLFSKKQMQEMKGEKPKKIQPPKKIKPDLTKRFEPSNGDLEKYNFFLKKEDLQKTYFEIVGDEEFDVNLGVPQYVLTTLSKFHNKNQEDLSVLDLVIFYNSLEDIFPEKIEYLELKKFSKAHGLFFGSSQYVLMEKHLEGLENN